MAEGLGRFRESSSISWLACAPFAGRCLPGCAHVFVDFPPPGRFHANQGVGVASIGRDYVQLRKQPGASQFSFPTLVGIQQLRFLCLKGFSPGRLYREVICKAFREL